MHTIRNAARWGAVTVTLLIFAAIAGWALFSSQESSPYDIGLSEGHNAIIVASSACNGSAHEGGAVIRCGAGVKGMNLDGSDSLLALSTVPAGGDLLFAAAIQVRVLMSPSQTVGDCETGAGAFADFSTPLGAGTLDTANIVTGVTLPNGVTQTWCAELTMPGIEFQGAQVDGAYLFDVTDTP